MSVDIVILFDQLDALEDDVLAGRKSCACAHLPALREAAVRLRDEMEERARIIAGFAERADSSALALGEALGRIEALEVDRDALKAIFDERLFFCGCCGIDVLKLGGQEDWCESCVDHVGPELRPCEVRHGFGNEFTVTDGRLHQHYSPLHERTYEAIHGEPCPFA